MKFNITYILAGLVLLVFSCSSTNKNEYIAKVDDKNISVNNFIERYSDFLKVSGMKDNLKLRHDFLKVLIDETILLSYADSSGFANKPDIRNILNIDRDQIYINYYFENYIYPELNVTENELREAFRRSKIQIHARHLYSPDLKGALKLKQELDSGYSFEELAKVSFNDPVLLSNGGDLGWFSFGEMDPAFENVAYSLEIGTISEPVKTRDGYSIVQVLNKKTEPFILEDEYKKNENWLRLEVKKRKHAAFLENKTDQILSELDINFDDHLVKELYEKLPEIKEELSSDNLLPELRLQNISTKVLKSKSGDWNVQRTLLKLSELQKRQWERVKTLDDFYAALKGLAIREEIENRIQKECIPENPVVIQMVNEHQRAQIIRKLVDNIKDTVQVDDKQLFEYYNTHNKEFKSPDIYEVAEIVVKDSALAWDIDNQIHSGADFSELAINYSINKRSSRNGGYLGWVEKRQFGKLAEAISESDINEVIGPLKNHDDYIFLNLLDKHSSRQLTFSESKSAITSILLPEKQKKSYFHFIKHLRNNVGIFKNDEVISKLIISPQRGIS